MEPSKHDKNFSQPSNDKRKGHSLGGVAYRELKKLCLFLLHHENRPLHQLYRAVVEVLICDLDFYMSPIESLENALTIGRSCQYSRVKEQHCCYIAVLPWGVEKGQSLGYVHV